MSGAIESVGKCANSLAAAGPLFTAASGWPITEAAHSKQQLVRDKKRLGDASGKERANAKESCLAKRRRRRRPLTIGRVR